MILLYLLTAIGLTPGGSSTVHIYTQRVHTSRTTQLTSLSGRFVGFEPRVVKLKLRCTNRVKIIVLLGRVRAVPRFATYTPAFALQLRKKHGKTCQDSRRVPTGTMKTEYTEQSIHNNKNT